MLRNAIVRAGEAAEGAVASALFRPPSSRAEVSTNRWLPGRRRKPLRSNCARKSLVIDTAASSEIGDCTRRRRRNRTRELEGGTKEDGVQSFVEDGRDGGEFFSAELFWNDLFACRQVGEAKTWSAPRHDRVAGNCRIVSSPMSPAVRARH